MAAYIVFEIWHIFGPSMLHPVYRSVVLKYIHRVFFRRRRRRQWRLSELQDGKVFLKTNHAGWRPLVPNVHRFL